MRRTMVFIAIGLIGLGGTPARAEPVPEALQGRWVDADALCDISGQAITFSANILAYPNGRYDLADFADGVITLEKSSARYVLDPATGGLIYYFGRDSEGDAMRRCEDVPAATERRCGWLDHPSSGTWLLIDGDGRWTISEAGAYEAALMERLPDPDPGAFVSTGDYNYGYYCSCMSVATEPGRIITIAGATQMPLQQCHGDAALATPER